MNPPEHPNPVVIGCVGGSGSRMLRDILAASPEIYMDQDCSPNSKDSRGSKVFLDRDDVGSLTYCKLIQQFMNQVVAQLPPEDRPKYKWFGWKNPRNIHIVDLLLDAHPHLRFLHLIRNPAALIDGSQGRKKFKRERACGNPDAQGDRASFVLRRWERTNLPVWRRHRNNPRYRLVYYEPFVTDPQRSTKSLYEWLGVRAACTEATLRTIAPPPDALRRGQEADITMIADAAAEMGYEAHVAVPKGVAVET